MDDTNKQNQPLSSLGNISTTPPVASNTDNINWTPKKKSKLKPILLGIFVLMLVSGFTLGAYYFTRNLNQASVPTAPESEPQAAGCGAKEEMTAKGCRLKEEFRDTPEKLAERQAEKEANGGVRNVVQNTCSVTAPTGGRVEFGASIGTASSSLAELFWTPGTGGVVRLWVSKHPDPTSNCLGINGDQSLCLVNQNSLPPTTNTYRLTGLTPDTTYYWRLMTWKEAGCDNSTGIMNFKTPPQQLSCSIKYYFQVSTEETNGENNGKCVATTNKYDTNNKDCALPNNTCTQNVRLFNPSTDQGNAVCYSSMDDCLKPKGKTANFMYFFNPDRNKCVSTNHRYDEQQIDVDGLPKSCSENTKQFTSGKADGKCFTSMSSCENNYKVACTDTTWTPNPNTVCSDDTLTQTSNCGKKRDVDGTKDCGVAGEPSVSMEKLAFADESANKAGDYDLSTQIDIVSKNETFVYAFDVTNDGDTDVTDIEVVDILKGDNQELLTYVDGDSRCKYTSSSREVKCSGMDLDAGDTDTYSFRVKVSSSATNGETILNVATLNYKDMPADGEVEESLELAISTVVGCNHVCTGDDECVSGLTCDTDTNKCRKPSCSEASSCNCPVERVTTQAPTRTATTVRVQPTVLPETGILDFPGVAAFGGGLLLAIVGILLAL